MPDEPAKPRAEPEPEVSEAHLEGDNDRPTVSPPFDPIAFARDILMPSAPPSDAHTKQTPAGGTAQHQMPTTPPGGAIPKSAISLANALAPSKPRRKPTIFGESRACRT